MLIANGDESVIEELIFHNPITVVCVITPLFMLWELLDVLEWGSEITNRIIIDELSSISILNKVWQSNSEKENGDRQNVSRRFS